MTYIFKFATDSFEDQLEFTDLEAAKAAHTAIKKALNVPEVGPLIALANDGFDEVIAT